MTLTTFGTALAMSYALTGLWTAHDSADRWAIAIAFAVAASGAVDKAVSPWADQAVPSAEPSGALAGDPAGDPSGPPPSTDPPGSPDGDPGADPSGPPAPGPPPPGDPSGGLGGDPSAGPSDRRSGSPSGSPDGLPRGRTPENPSGRTPENPPGRTPEPSGPARRARARALTRARDRVTTAVVAAAVTATASGIVYEAVAPDQGHADTASSVSAGYTRVYAHRRMFLKDYHYYFDLRAGRSSPTETEWSVSTDAGGGDGYGAFEIQPLTDAYVVAGRAAPTAAQCAAKAVHHPAEDRLSFRDAPPGRTFCLRDTTNGDIAVVSVLDADHGNYSTTDTVTYYRHRSRALADRPD
ncbi:hypothetical protein [Streptomyces sp. NPDC001123]